MTIANHLKAIKSASAYGAGVCVTAALGIWGARYVSFLPKLPIKTAGVAGAITFLTTFVAENTFTNKKNNLTENQKIFLYCFITICGGTACVTYAKRAICSETTSIPQLIRNVMIGKKTFFYQLVATSFVENIVGFVCLVHLPKIKFF